MPQKKKNSASKKSQSNKAQKSKGHASKGQESHGQESKAPQSKSAGPKSARANTISNKGKRALAVKVKSAKGRKISSTRWLQRQLNDPYVQRAKDDGLRSRAAYKLIEMDDQYKLIQPGMTVIDLGAAPGGWSQVAAKRANSIKGKGQVVAIDISAMEPLPGVEVIHLDFMDDDAPNQLIKALKKDAVDIVMSDMAEPATGHKQTDHLRIIGLAEAALEFAIEVLKPEGVFLAKVLQGGTEQDLLNLMKKNFKKTRHIKPQASRADSSELYVMATGFKGRDL